MYMNKNRHVRQKGVKMITKVSYRPYAQGVNNTQNQKQKVHFGMNTTDAATAFATELTAALGKETELKRIVHVNTAINNLLHNVPPGAPSVDLLRAIRNALTGNPSK